MNPLEGKCSFWPASMCVLWGGDEFQIWAGGGHTGTRLCLLNDRCFDRTSLLLLIPPVVPVKQCYLASPQRLSLLSLLLLINTYLCLRYMSDKSGSLPGEPARFDRLLLFNNAWWWLLIQFQATAMDDAHTVQLVGKWPCKVKVAMDFLHDIKGLTWSS